MSRSGIVNVRMVITEEKILSNIDKVHKLINPNNKKQIIQLEDDAYFKDLIESIKTYLVEYPKKKKLREVLRLVENKEEDWKEEIKNISNDFSEDIVDTLGLIGRSKSDKSQNYQDAVKLINARIVNLESNLHIEIDMERIEDRSKALSYIGIEVADALKLIPAPQEDEIEEIKEENIENIEEEPVINEPQNVVEPEPQQQYFEQTRVEVKPSLWQRFKNSKFVKAISYIMKIKVVIQTPEALPEGRGENR